MTGDCQRCCAFGFVCPQQIIRRADDAGCGFNRSARFGFDGFDGDGAKVSKAGPAGEPRAKEPVGSRRGVTLCGGGAVGASALENGAADDRRAVLMMRGIRRVPGMSTGVRNGVYVVWFFLVKLGFHDNAFGGDDKSG